MPLLLTTLFPVSSEALELGCQLAQHELESIKLKSKSTGEEKSFSLVKEERLLKDLDRRSRVSRYDMSKLEVEYDYDTESEQIAHSKTMLNTDLYDAIEWFVMEDPLNIVNNFDI